MKLKSGKAVSLFIVLCMIISLMPAMAAFASPDALADTKGVTVSAKVDKLSGNQNRLWITVNLPEGDPIIQDFIIDNNAEGVYTVKGGYKIYVDTKGNTQIRACYLVRLPAFTVAGNKILDPEDNELILKGLNMQGPGAWETRDITQDVDLVADAWKFNSIRLICGTKWPASASAGNSNFEKIVDAFTSRGIVVMIDQHDYTSILPDEDRDRSYINDENHRIPSWNQFLAWWEDKAIRFKDNPYVWFNIMNEPAGENGMSQEVAQTWYDLHDEAIQVIRNTGANNIIVLDDYFWGQANGYYHGKNSWDSAVQTMGPALNAKYDNLVFSLHVYEQWSGGVNRFQNYFNDAWNSGMCVIIGEYGIMTGFVGQHNAIMNMFNAVIPNNVGRMLYAWTDTALPLTYTNAEAKTGSGRGYQIDKTDGSIPGNLRYVGELVWLDNHGELTVPAPMYEYFPLLQNGDFQSSFGNSNWQNWGNVSRQTNAASVPGGYIPDGKTAYMRIGASGWSGGWSPQSLDLQPNTTYTFTAWGAHSRALNANEPATEIDIHYMTDAGEEFKYILSFTEGAWTEKSFTFTTGDDVSGGQILVSKESETNGLYFYGANFRLE